MEKTIFLCDVCKMEFKTDKSLNKHAKEFGLNFKLIDGVRYYRVNLKKFLDHVLESN